MNGPLRDVRRLVDLALPAIAGQFAAMFLWVIDTVMLGHLSIEDLGAASLGRVWIMATIGFALGLVLGIDPVAARAHGAGDRQRLESVLRNGLLLTLLISFPLALTWLATGPALALFEPVPALIDPAARYVWVQIPSLPFFMAYFTCRQFLLGQGIVRPAMWIAIAANLVNAFANWILIYGNLGFPALGSTGAGIATAVTQVAMAAALIVWMERNGLPLPRPQSWYQGRKTLTGMHELAVLGLPVAFQIGFEIWAWQIATLFAGRLGEVPLAAHTVVLTLVSVTFMVPLGLSFAVVARVGNLLGEGRPADAQRTAWVSFALGAGLMVLASVGFLIGQDALPKLFTHDTAAVALAAAMMPIVALFQVFDGVQVVGSGILRGMGKTRPAAVFNLFGYYALALPLAAWWVFEKGWGLAGLWWALCLGLGVVAVLLVGWITIRGPAHEG